MIRCIVDTTKCDTPIPEWLATAFVDGHEIVYLPLAVMGSEAVGYIAAAEDGVGLHVHEGHYYAPSDWLAHVFPSIADDMRHTARKVIDKMATFPGGPEMMAEERAEAGE